MRRVLYISGSRADYGPARRLLKAIQADPDLDLSILAVGMHLDPLHGETWREIKDDGFAIAKKVDERVSGDSLPGMAGSLGLYLHSMSQAMADIQPDIVLVFGDRGEQLAGAMAGAFQNINVAHLCGGSLSGSIDDSIRHAITKFAHYHFPSFEEHAQRIIQMGEEPETVLLVGLPGGDLAPDVTFTREQVCSDLGLPFDSPYILVVQHSVTQSYSATKGQIVETLEAVKAMELPVLLANPNDDAGGRVILKTMDEYSKNTPRLQVLPPVSNREMFASIMAHASVLVGNSSSAVVEAMSVALPVVNVGDRQRGREHLAKWTNAGYDREEIRQAINYAINDERYHRELVEFRRDMPARDTDAMVVNSLKTMDLKRASRPKLFHDSRISKEIETGAFADTG